MVPWLLVTKSVDRRVVCHCSEWDAMVGLPSAMPMIPSRSSWTSAAYKTVAELVVGENANSKPCFSMPCAGAVLL
jgi:hypothetical protein